ncbi:MAG: outer membrane beta-barrel protein [Alphaproteobacteria bacterium]|nr:outer membrane beta-barrel protein [Alphaproteobacteria bacterium]
MKKIIVSTLAVLMACPAFAGMNNPNQGSSWTMWGMDPYVGLRGGVSYTNLNYRYNGQKESMTDTVLQGRAALGLEVCDKVRSEVEWSIFGKLKDTHDFGTAGSVDVEAKMQTLLMNTYWEFGPYQIVRPFAGLGAGVAFTDVKRSGNGIERHGESKARFSAMGTMGVTFDMERFAVDLAARYNYVDINSGLHNFGADVGIRFMF